MPERQYRLQHCLGRGGFGEVYLAVMEAGAVRTDVAVKLLNAGLAPEDQAVERLRDEGRLLGVLNHPVILKVHDLLILQGRVALVTEYVDGADLDDCLTNPMPVRALVEVVGRIADALDVAFSSLGPSGARLGLVHRDIKPANIRIGRHGDVKLLDFGIAFAADAEREAKTQTASIVGTLRYMAPERFDPTTPIAPPADVFSLGAVLFEGVMGERLFAHVSQREMYLMAMDGDDHEVFVSKRMGELPNPLAPEQATLLARMLAYEAAERPSAGEVARACEALVDQLGGADSIVGLRQYCRERAWTPVVAPDAPDPLNGTMLSAVNPAIEPVKAQRRPRVAWMVVAMGGLGMVLAMTSAAGLVFGVAFFGWMQSETTATPGVAAGPVAVGPPNPVPGPVSAPAEGPAEDPPTLSRPRSPTPAQVLGAFTAEGDVVIELRGDQAYRPGPLPAGAYGIWADFGTGFERMGEAMVQPRKPLIIRCSRLRHNCSGGP